MVAKNASALGWVSFRSSLTVSAVLLLGACTTTSTGDRYARYYDACDQSAGLCYANCDDYEGEDRELCQADCSEEVDQCFADVSRRIAAEQSSYTLSSSYVFYGRHGYWGPSYGYRYGPHGRPYSYAPWRDPYYRGYRSGYRSGYYYGQRHDDRDHRRRERRDRDDRDDAADTDRQVQDRRYIRPRDRSPQPRDEMPIRGTPERRGVPSADGTPPRTRPPRQERRPQPAQTRPRSEPAPVKKAPTRRPPEPIKSEGKRHER